MRAIAQTTTLTWDGRDNEDAKYLVRINLK